MQLEKYRSEHSSLIHSWLRSRDMDHTMADEPPEIGFVVFDENEAICMAFLRKIEGNVAFLDNLTTNPLISSSVRNKCIDFLVTKIIEEAVNLGFKGLLAYSTDESTLIRSKKHGFLPMPHTLISLNLSCKREIFKGG